MLMIGIGLVFLACPGNDYPRTLDAKYALGLKATLNSTTRQVDISGLCGHSGLVVELVEIQRTETTTKILVRLTPAPVKDLTGNFSVSVPVDGVETIVFGDDGTVVWQNRTQPE
jgi:hypothetical protein